ncbi:MAG TPA: PDZ domain-containing protein, partial [Caldilineaceae bacterium]|nr:PDZ domain-containing protein [Caldilineaceae bacterium]
MQFWPRLLAGLLLWAWAGAYPAFAQPDEPFAPAPIAVDEGGPVMVTGRVRYTNPFFTVGVTQPLILLEDQAGFIDRDPSFLLPLASQTLGQITSDFRRSPFTYALALPAAPQASLRDVDQDGRPDPGVMVFAVAYWTNVFGSPFLEERDLLGGGWSTAYASTRVADVAGRRHEVVGGKLLVYAPAAGQGFPSGFGVDGLLFTADDPMVGLPPGYTLVDLDHTPFTFDRSRTPRVDLIEPEMVALDDFSGLSYSEAFDALIAKLRREYAFTAYKGIDWDALADTFRPRMVQAERAQDRNAYLLALHDFSLAIPDGHIQGPRLPAVERERYGGGFGMAIRELDDGRVLVVFVAPDGPAARAGLTPRAEIIAIDGQPIQDALAQVEPWNGPFSTAHTRRLQQLRYVL